MSDRLCDSEHCSATECEAHKYVMNVIDELKEVSGKLMEGQSDIKETVVKLSENILEQRRLGERIDKLMEELKDKDKDQDLAIRENSAFVNKAIGVVGAISLLSGLIAAVAALIAFFVK